MQIAGNPEVLSQSVTQLAHFRDHALVRDRRRELHGIKPLLFPCARELATFGQRVAWQARNIAVDFVVISTAQQLVDGQAGLLTRDVPQGDIDSRQRIEVVAAVVTAYPHEIVKPIVNEPAHRTDRSR